MHWISVKKGLPEEDEHVFVHVSLSEKICTKGEKNQRCYLVQAFYSCDVFEGRSEKTSWMDLTPNVTHWFKTEEPKEKIVWHSFCQGNRIVGAKEVRDDYSEIKEKYLDIDHPNL